MIQLKPCWKHGEYKYVGPAPLDNDGSTCAICESGRELMLKDKDIKNIERRAKAEKAAPERKETSKEATESKPEQKCKIHPLYKGLRKPRGDCGFCVIYWNSQRTAGIRETRKKGSRIPLSD